VSAIILVFGLSRSDIASYVNALFLVYLIILFTRILLSWIPRLPYNPVLRSVVSLIDGGIRHAKPAPVASAIASPVGENSACCVSMSLRKHSSAS